MLFVRGKDTTFYARFYDEISQSFINLSSSPSIEIYKITNNDKDLILSDTMSFTPSDNTLYFYTWSIPLNAELGEYQAVITVNSFYPIIYNFQIVEQNRLTDTATFNNIVEIEVLDNNSNPIQDTHIRVYFSSDTNYSNCLSYGLTNSEGKVIFDLEDGDYNLILFKEGYIINNPYNLTVSGNTTLTITLNSFNPSNPPNPNLCTVYGWVIMDTEPVENATVSARRANISDCSINNEIVALEKRETTTDANGYFELSLIPSELLIPETNYIFEISYGNYTKMIKNVSVPNSPSFQLTVN